MDDCSTKVALHVRVKVVFFSCSLVEKYEGIGVAIVRHSEAVLFTLNISHVSDPIDAIRFRAGEGSRAGRALALPLLGVQV